MNVCGCCRCCYVDLGFALRGRVWGMVGNNIVKIPGYYKIESCVFYRDARVCVLVSIALYMYIGFTRMCVSAQQKTDDTFTPTNSNGRWSTTCLLMLLLRWWCWCRLNAAVLTVQTLSLMRPEPPMVADRLVGPHLPNVTGMWIHLQVKLETGIYMIGCSHKTKKIWRGKKAAQVWNQKKQKTKSYSTISLITKYKSIADESYNYAWLETRPWVSNVRLEHSKECKEKQIKILLTSSVCGADSRRSRTAACSSTDECICSKLPKIEYSIIKRKQPNNKC